MIQETWNPCWIENQVRYRSSPTRHKSVSLCRLLIIRSICKLLTEYVDTPDPLKTDTCQPVHLDNLNHSVKANDRLKSDDRDPWWLLLRWQDRDFSDKQFSKTTKRLRCN